MRRRSKTTNKTRSNKKIIAYFSAEELGSSVDKVGNPMDKTIQTSYFVKISNNTTGWATEAITPYSSGIYASREAANNYPPIYRIKLNEELTVGSYLEKYGAIEFLWRYVCPQSQSRGGNLCGIYLSKKGQENLLGSPSTCHSIDKDMRTIVSINNGSRQFRTLKSTETSFNSIAVSYITSDHIDTISTVSCRIRIERNSSFLLWMNGVLLHSISLQSIDTLYNFKFNEICPFASTRMGSNVIFLDAAVVAGDTFPEINTNYSNPHVAYDL